jgi:hypothetical protein
MSSEKVHVLILRICEHVTLNYKLIILGGEKIPEKTTLTEESFTLAEDFRGFSP